MGQRQDVGIGGLTLGGGEGVLSGLYGATCDNVSGIEIVTADGSIRRPTARENPDLLWGTCGGAGNLGAVTVFEYRLYSVDEVVAGWTWYPLSAARKVMQRYRDFTRTIPDSLFSEFSVQRPDEKELLVGVFVFHSEPARAGKDLAPLDKFGPTIRSSVKKRPYLEGQASAGFPVVWGMSSY
jgi:hypothetical protein